MPVTRSQAAKIKKEEDGQVSSKRRDVGKVVNPVKGGEKEHSAKKSKIGRYDTEDTVEEELPYLWQTGTIERGHIYFFYRPKVQLEEAHSIEDVKNLHMLLVPQPSILDSYSTNDDSKAVHETMDQDSEMKLLSPGADAIPQRPSQNQAWNHFRLITIGKKQLPKPKAKGVFWASVVMVGDNLHALEQGLGEKNYETKTRGVRHNEAARLAARGAYAIVNNDPRVPSGRETHLGYYLSHPVELGDVHVSLGIQRASSFVLQVKNPLAPTIRGQNVGLNPSRRAEFPEKIMREVFGRGTRGRESYGLRFTSCGRADLLDYEGAELLLIAAREGSEGLEQSLGGSRGKALQEIEESEGKNISISEVLSELALSEDVFSPDPLEGRWI